MPEAAERHRVGEFRYWDKMDAKKVLRETGEHVDIEARWPQKIGERERQVGEGKGRHRNKDQRKKLLRREAEA